jgi:hypothetical protein
MTATSPAEASGNRQLQSDISPMPQPQAGARLAENVAPLALRRPTDQPVVTPPPTTASPLPEQKPGEFDPSPPPPKPAPEPRSKEQFDAEQRAIYLESRGAPAETVKSWRDQAAILEAERARKEAYTTKQYESDLAQYNARETAKATARQKIPETQETLKQQRLTTQQAQQKQDLEAQFGNLPQHVHEYLAKGKENTMLAVNSLEGLKNARMAMDAGTLFGIDAPIKLLYYQARAAAGDADASRIVAATQNYKTSLGPLAAQAIRAYGGTQISNQDRIMGMQMSGADVSLDEKSARRLLDIAERSAVAKINEHRGDLDNMLQKQPPMLRRMYDVPDPLAPVPADKGAGAPKEFASEADAAAARLPRGTKVRINGRMGTVQ